MKERWVYIVILLLVTAFGGCGWSAGGAGGGASGGAATGGSSQKANGGTQSSGYARGQGQNGRTGIEGYRSREGTGGGGGGYYGGYAQQTSYSTNMYCGGGGGSGYTTGLSGASMSNGVREGNGYARITFVNRTQ